MNGFSFLFQNPDNSINWILKNEKSWQPDFDLILREKVIEMLQTRLGIEPVESKESQSNHLAEADPHALVKQPAGEVANDSNQLAKASFVLQDLVDYVEQQEGKAKETVASDSDQLADAGTGLSVETGPLTSVNRRK